MTILLFVLASLMYLLSIAVLIYAQAKARYIIQRAEAQARQMVQQMEQQMEQKKRAWIQEIQALRRKVETYENQMGKVKALMLKKPAYFEEYDPQKHAISLIKRWKVPLKPKK